MTAETLLFERIGVVGCGAMGSGIAEVCLRSGAHVLAWDVHDAAVEAGRHRLETAFARAVEAGKITEDQRSDALSRVAFTTDLGDMADRQFVIEAVLEIEDMKLEVFRKLDSMLAAPDAILASNTSSIPITKIAAATKRGGYVIGMHFFNPPAVMKLVEIIPSVLTSDETVARVSQMATQQLGKVVVKAHDRAGFVVNALLVPYILSAVRMLEDGVATAEDIDTGIVEGCRHPMGPLALADLIGLDVCKGVADSMYDEFKEPLYAAPPLLNRMVEAGRLGKKTGRGFYTYGK